MLAMPPNVRTLIERPERSGRQHEVDASFSSGEELFSVDFTSTAKGNAPYREFHIRFDVYLGDVDSDTRWRVNDPDELRRADLWESRDA
jgi:hypothetical protein